MSRREIRIAGFGGQGVVLSGEILGKAASVFTSGYATFTQNYGPESRGGASCAELVISDEPIDYPYVVSPEIQILLSQEAYTKYGREQSATVTIIDSDLVKVEPEHEPKSLSIPASRMAREELSRPIVANIIMLGFLAAVSDVVSQRALKDAILSSIPAGTESMNMKAFELGYNYGIKYEKQD